MTAVEIVQRQCRRFHKLLLNCSSVVSPLSPHSSLTLKQDVCCVSFRFLVLSSVSVRSDPLDRGDDAPCALFEKFLSMCIVDGFAIGTLVLNDSHFKLLCFEKFHISRGSCFMTDERDLSCSHIPVGILACDLYGQVSRCSRIGDTARNFIEV